MKEIITLLFVLLFLNANSQPIFNEWTTPLHLNPSDISVLPNKISAFFSDEDLGPGTYLKHFSLDGDSLSSVPIPAIDFGLTSAYSTTQKSYFVAGYNTFDSTLIAKTDTLGNLLWKKSFGPSGYEFSVLYKIIPLDSSVIITCSFFTYLSSSVKSAVCYYKLGLYGDLIHQSAIQSLPQGEDEYLSYDAVIDTDGNIYIASTNLEKSRLTKFNGITGAVLWSKPYNQLDIQSLSISEDNFIIASGGDNFISKLDNNGNLVYSESLGDSATHLSEQIFVRQNNIYSIGRYTPDNLPFGGAYVGSYDFETGVRNWGWYFDDHSSNGSAYALFSGDFLNDSTLFVNGVGSFPDNSYQYFFSKLKISGTSGTQNATSLELPFVIYPNPTSNGIINFSYNRSEGNIIISDAQGNIISNFEVTERNNTIIPHYGVYFISYSNYKERFVQKIVYCK